jgi:hypothetical protein
MIPNRTENLKKFRIMLARITSTIEPIWKNNEIQVWLLVAVRTLMLTIETIPRYTKFPSSHMLPPCCSKGINETRIRTRACQTA